MRTMILLFAVVLLACAGCADTGSLGLGSSVVDGQQVVQITGQIKDASAQKEALFIAMRQNRDTMQAKMYKDQGFKLEWESVEKTVFYPGMTAPITIKEPMPKVTFKEAPRFADAAPTGPSEHPMWKTANKFIDKAADTFLWWTGITKLFDFGNHAVDNASTQYHGDYVNQTAAPYIIEPTVITVPQ